MKENSSTSKFTKADFIAQFLARKEVGAVFQLSGGMIAFISDAISRLGVTEIINTRHEQAAGFAAEGFSRECGRAAVAMGTSGPGATNLITAIGSCYFDSVPVLFITGQVNQRELRLNPKQRQNGFQELDIVSVVKPIVKHATRITTESDISIELEKAWEIAHEGRKGPVLVDIPIDVQQEYYEYIESVSPQSQKTYISTEVVMAVNNLFGLLTNAKRPIILAGGGIRSSGATSIFRELVNKLRIPVVKSLMGIDSLNFDSEFHVGMIGSYGNSWANAAISKSDLLICVGTRLDVRQTGSDLSSFTENKIIFRIDQDPYEISGRVQSDFSYNIDLVQFITEVNKSTNNIDYSSLMGEINEFRYLNPQQDEQESVLETNPNLLLESIGEMFYDSNGYVVDVGQHQMWAAQSLKIRENQRFITSGGMGAMGFALPAAIGAAVSKAGQWVVIAGDGCTQLSISELQTLFANNLSITVCVINNNQHGMVAQFQESNMDGRFFGTRQGYSAPDFASVASAFGISAKKYTTIKAFEADQEFINSRTSGPLLLEFVISEHAKALPKMGSQKTNLEL